MTVSSVTKDLEALSLTLVMDFDHPVDKVWQLYADPRKLERWWGPPEWPASFATHEFVPGGSAAYYMTGPEGERSSGWWRFIAIEPETTIEILDGFADADGAPTSPELNSRMVVTFEPTAAGTRVTTVSHFSSLEHLEQLVAMGMEEGLAAAVGQMDAVLADF